MTDRYIRQSQISKFRQCRRSWWLEYVRGLEKVREPGVSKGSRSLGTLVHLGVEEHYRGGDWRAALNGEEIRLGMDGEWSEEWSEHFNLASIMLEGWEEWLAYTGADANEEVVLNEAQLEWEVGTFHGDRVFLTGKPDLVKRDVETGVVIVEDTKTVTRFSDPIIHGGQGLSYALMLRALFGLHVNVFRTTQFKKVKRTSRATPPFYVRSELLVNEQSLVNHYEHLKIQLAEMVLLMQQWEKEGEAAKHKFYPSPGPTCEWGCDFLHVCAVMDDGSNYEHLLQIDYRKKPDNEPAKEEHNES